MSLLGGSRILSWQFQASWREQRGICLLSPGVCVVCYWVCYSSGSILISCFSYVSSSLGRYRRNKELCLGAALLAQLHRSMERVSKHDQPIKEISGFAYSLMLSFISSSIVLFLLFLCMTLLCSFFCSDFCTRVYPFSSIQVWFLQCIGYTHPRFSFVCELGKCPS